MCIALHKPAGVVLDDATLKNCYDNNPDGAGFAFAHDGQIVIKKGFFTFDEFLAAFREHQERDCIVHFRIATHGTVCAANCHPWEIKEFEFSGDRKFSFAVIHNGILSYTSTKEKSDTGHFVDEILAPHFQRDPFFAFDEIGQFFLERAIGPGNKLVILRNDGKVAIINRKAGTDDRKCWFSNMSYKNERWKTSFTNSRWPAGVDDYDGYEDMRPTVSGRVRIPSVKPAPTIPSVSSLPWTDKQRADLRHLPKRDRKALRKAAKSLCYGLYAADEVSAMTEADMVAHLRDEFRASFTTTTSCTDAVVDKLIVDCNFVSKVFGFEDVDADPVDVGPVEDDEGVAPMGAPTPRLLENVPCPSAEANDAALAELQIGNQEQ